MSGFVTNLRTSAVDAVAAQVAETKHFQRYKGTWLIILSGLVGMIGGITPYLAGAPVWVVPVVSAIATFAAALVNRLTKDGFTPSMAGRIVDFIPDVEVQEVEKPETSVESAIASARHAAESTASELRTQADNALESARAAYRDATRREYPYAY